MKNGNKIRKQEKSAAHRTRTSAFAHQKHHCRNISILIYGITAHNILLFVQIRRAHEGGGAAADAGYGVVGSV